MKFFMVQFSSASLRSIQLVLMRMSLGPLCAPGERILFVPFVSVHRAQAHMHDESQSGCMVLVSSVKKKR